MGEEEHQEEKNVRSSAQVSFRIGKPLLEYMMSQPNFLAATKWPAQGPLMFCPVLCVCVI